MLTDTQVEQLFIDWQTPNAGRALVRKIRAQGPVRALQYRMDGVRTRFISTKMGRAVYAESRTCEFPALYIREHDPETAEYWPQPCTLDLNLAGAKGGRTRLQHTPDLFLIENGFVIEEWRELPRLLRLAAERPEHFYRDAEGQWHYMPVEEHLKELGITYRLRCSDEHPRAYLSNLSFLEDYSLETTPPVPAEERQRLTELMAQHALLPHLSLVLEHGFKADHVFQLILDGTVFVDLYETVLHQTGELVIYRNQTAWRADAVFRKPQTLPVPSSALVLTVGMRFLFDAKEYEVALLGKTQVTAREVETGANTLLSVELVESLFREQMVVAKGEQHLHKEFDQLALFNNKRLGEALTRMDALANPETAKVSERQVRRYRAQTKGISAPQEQLQALVSRNAGNTTPRLPEDVVKLAEQAVEDFHNRANNPKVLATYNFYVDLCSNAGAQPMSRSNFYRWIASREDVAAREGKRKAYQKAPIPLAYDYLHPVHGVLSHEVCYCDHTIMNVMLKGSALPNLGKPTITLMADGADSKARAFFLSYRPASAVSVLMCLRDYVRRNGRLPRMLVLDNGKEFHSEALLMFCSLFGIAIRWRRRSRPRDSSIIERMLGATEQEVIAQLDGNSLALKDPRMVSTTHHPDKHIEWTLPGLHGAIEYYLFEVHAKRIHPRLKMSPDDMEKRLAVECGARGHVIVRYDETLKLLTAPHSGSATRKIDRMRGVYVDGFYYWHDKLALAKPGETAEVRVELWRARAVYVCFRNEWYVAQARDGGVLEGRYRPEFEMQQREEARVRKNAAAKDKVTAKNSKKRTQLWKPEVWDSRLREQLSEMYYLYDRLGMTEVLSDAKNPSGSAAALGLHKGSELELIDAVTNEQKFLTLPDGNDELPDAEEGPPPEAPPRKPRAKKAAPASGSKPGAPATQPAPTAAPSPAPSSAPAAQAPLPAEEAQDDPYF